MMFLMLHSLQPSPGGGNFILAQLYVGVHTGKHDVCNYYTQGYVPGGREWVPNSLGNASWERRVKRIGVQRLDMVEKSINPLRTL
jgi:hypothetical protein